MAKYKFNIGKQALSDEQINRHKNFKKLMHEYDHMVKPLYQKPLYKNPKSYLVILLIVLIAYLIATYT